MEALNSLITFCSDNYHFPPCERGCNCGNNSCENCLKEIHWNNSSSKTYNCRNLNYYYICKFGYRYTSEIYYLLKEFLDDFKKLPDINIISLGCGPCTELFAFADIFEDCFNYINYYGCEITTNWDIIHRHLNQTFDTDYYYLKFIHEDAIGFMQKEKEKLINYEYPIVFVLNS